MNQSTVQIVTREELLGRHQLLDQLLLHTLPPGRVFALGVDPFPGILGIEIARDRIARIGPLIETETLSLPVRETLWVSAVGWARDNQAIAVQIVCSETDLAALSALGFQKTTDIVELVAEIESPRDTIRDKGISHRELPPNGQDLELVQQSLTQSRDLPEALPLRPRRGDLEPDSPDAHPLVLVAHSPTDRVGILYANLSSQTASIRYLGVLPIWRNQGWGRRLVNEACRLAAARECQRITTYVDIRNIPAVRLYESLGFTRQFAMPLIFRAWCSTEP